MNQKSLFLAHFFGPNGLILGCHNFLVQVGYFVHLLNAVSVLVFGLNLQIRYTFF